MPLPPHNSSRTGLSTSVNRTCARWVQQPTVSNIRTISMYPCETSAWDAPAVVKADACGEHGFRTSTGKAARAPIESCGCRYRDGAKPLRPPPCWLAEWDVVRGRTIKQGQDHAANGSSQQSRQALWRCRTSRGGRRQADGGIRAWCRWVARCTVRQPWRTLPWQRGSTKRPPRISKRGEVATSHICFHHNMACKPIPDLDSAYLRIPCDNTHNKEFHAREHVPNKGRALFDTARPHVRPCKEVRRDACPITDIVKCWLHSSQVRMLRKQVRRAIALLRY